MKKRTYTLLEFAEKIGVNKTTVWRWTKTKDGLKRFKMHDAEFTNGLVTVSK